MAFKIRKNEEGSWAFTDGKYEGVELEKVAGVDPNYLRWVYKKASLTFNDEAFYALEDIMLKFEIPLPS